jgi:hypothetical protein
MRLYRFCAWSLWAVLPVMAFGYWQVWDRLPLQLAVRFNDSNLPIAYMTPHHLLVMELMTTTMVVSIASLISVLVPNERRPDVVSWFGLGFFYGIVGLLLWCQYTLLHYQLIGLPMSVRASINFIDPTVVSLGIASSAGFIGWKLWNWMISQT